LYRFHELSTMVRAHPAEAKAIILTALTRARGAELAAAELLGVSTRTLRRWVAQLGLKDQLERLRKLWLLRGAKPGRMGTKVKAARRAAREATE
jgi:hypothetical protein